MVLSRILHVQIKFKPIPPTDTVEVGGSHGGFNIQITIICCSLISAGKDLTEDDLGQLAA